MVTMGDNTIDYRIRDIAFGMIAGGQKRLLRLHPSADTNENQKLPD